MTTPARLIGIAMAHVHVHDDARFDTLIAATEDGRVWAALWAGYGDEHPREAGVEWEALPPVPGTAAALGVGEAVEAAPAAR